MSLATKAGKVVHNIHVSSIRGEYRWDCQCGAAGRTMSPDRERIERAGQRHKTQAERRDFQTFMRLYGPRKAKA